MIPGTACRSIKELVIDGLNQYFFRETGLPLIEEDYVDFPPGDEDPFFPALVSCILISSSVGENDSLEHFVSLPCGLSFYVPHYLVLERPSSGRTKVFSSNSLLLKWEELFKEKFAEACKSAVSTDSRLNSLASAVSRVALESKECIEIFGDDGSALFNLEEKINLNWIPSV